MKNYCIMILALCACVAMSCGKGIKPRPLAANSSAAVRETMASAPSEAKSQPTPLDEYDLNFWDSLDNRAFPDPHLRADTSGSLYKRGSKYATASRPNPSRHPQARSRMHAAYRLGIAFASNDPEQVQQRLRLVRMTTPSVVSADTASIVGADVDSLFLQCVARADGDNEHGMAAVMVSGYYFGNLSKILQNVNPDTQLPDEKTVESAISRIENLKKYINQALTSERDVNATMLLQDIQARADSITKVYGNLTFASQDKFQQLIGDINNVDNCF
ncbi:MAG: hypothetical protein MJZ66_00265 [Bacteroidales bacterium]|nr:hypothetical protein [Bacteroidales bacterium]